MTEVTKDEVLKFKADAAFSTAHWHLKQSLESIQYVMRTIETGRADLGTLPNVLTSLGTAIRKSTEGNTLMSELSDTEE